MSNSHLIQTIPEALENFDKTPNSAFIRLPIVMRLYGVSAATIWHYTETQQANRTDNRVECWPSSRCACSKGGVICTPIAIPQKIKR